MLPVGAGHGPIWRKGRLLCDVGYEISEPLAHSGNHIVQRITFTVEDKDCISLLRSHGLTLVLADGSQHSIPRPLQRIQSNELECYVEFIP